MLKLFLKKRAIKCALRKPTPQRFSIDRENWHNIDYFSTSLKFSEGENRDIFIERFNGQEISGLRWNGNRYEEQISIPIVELNNALIEITHHFRSVRIRYDGPMSFFFGQVSLLRYRVLLKEWWSQRRFNSQLRFRTDRIEILKEIVEIHINRVEDDPFAAAGASGISAWNLFKRIHGQRAFNHPNSSSALTRFEMILNSLVSSNDLSLDEQSRYRLEPRSLQTISEHEVEQQRHTDNIRHNWLIFFLTLVLAAAAIMGAWTDWSQLPDISSDLSKE